MNRITWIAGLLLCQSLAFAQQATPPAAPETEQPSPSPIGYASVQEAFEALSADPAASQSFYEGWTIFNTRDNGRYVIWSFTPDDHPVHPSAIRREIVSKDGEVFINMAILCYASRLDCDLLVEQYEQINENLKRRLTAGS